MAFQTTKDENATSLEECLPLLRPRLANSFNESVGLVQPHQPCVSLAQGDVWILYRSHSMVTPWSKVVGSSIQFWLLEINPHAKSYVVKGKVVQCAIVFAVNTALNNEAATVDLSRVVAAPRWRTRVGNIPIDATSVGRLVKSSMEHDLELLGTNWADLSLVIHVYPLGWLVVAVVFASLEEALLVHF